jgi:hypothetical protein
MRDALRVYPPSRPLNIPQNKNIFFWQHLTLKKSKNSMRYIGFLKNI